MYDLVSSQKDLSVIHMLAKLCCTGLEGSVTQYQPSTWGVVSVQLLYGFALWRRNPYCGGFSAGVAGKGQEHGEEGR